MTPTFILVPGAWHGAWCWQRVTPLLASRGVQIITPELTGMGTDRTTALPRPALHAWAAQLAAIAQAQTGPVILVGHSRGGVLISQAAELAADHVAGLIYLAAFLVPSGETMQQTVRAAGLMRHFALTVAPDGLTTSLVPEAVPDRLYNTTPLDWAARAVSLLSPEPAELAATAPSLTVHRFGRVPRAYIRCSQDQVIVPAMQDWLLARMPCDPVLTLASDHCPFFSAPADLADALAACAAPWIATQRPVSTHR